MRMGRLGCWLGPFWSCFFFHWGRFGRGRFGLRGPFSTFIGAVLAMGRFGRFPIVAVLRTTLEQWNYARFVGYQQIVDGIRTERIQSCKLNHNRQLALWENFKTNWQFYDTRQWHKGALIECVRGRASRGVAGSLGADIYSMLDVRRSHYS